MGTWKVILTPSVPVPRSWFGDLRGRRVLCLSSGGGQQAPVLAAAGARVVSFDLSRNSSRRTPWWPNATGSPIDCVQGNMTDLSCFGDGCRSASPSANSFVADVRPVWRMPSRKLAGFNNPAVFLFDHDEADRTGTLVVKHGIMPTPRRYPHRRWRKDARKPSREIRRRTDWRADRAGFAIVGFTRWFDDSWLFSTLSPVSMAPRAAKSQGRCNGIQHIMQTDETIGDRSPAFNFMRAPAPLLPRPPG